MIQTPITIESINIADHFQSVSQLMKLLHENEREMFDKTALWVDIEQNYMRHCIAMQKDCEGTFLMAYVEAEAVGFIFGYIEEQDDSRTETYTGRELYISDGFVLDSQPSKSLKSLSTKSCCIKSALKFCRIFVKMVKCLQIYVCYLLKKQAPRWDYSQVLQISLTRNTHYIY